MAAMLVLVVKQVIVQVNYLGHLKFLLSTLADNYILDFIILPIVAA